MARACLRVLIALLPLIVSASRSWTDGFLTLLPSKETGSLLPLSGYTDAARKDQIGHLPGLKGHMKTRQFSGYLEVNATSGRNIFYWFVEAEKDPANAPVLFWTNGGPGCSGLIGYLTEHGPYRVVRDGSELKENPYAWTKEANIFYVEQPAGVGFSYSEDPDFYFNNLGDVTATEDNYRIINKFFEKFPQFQKNEFYLSSESYGGHYLPMLAKLVVDKQEALEADSPEKLNFKGFLVGNPFNNLDENQIGMVSAFWGRQLVPKPAYDQWFKKCVVDSSVCPTWATDCNPQDRQPDEKTMAECTELMWKMRKMVGNLDMYGLDWPVCHDPVKVNGRQQRLALRAALASSETMLLGADKEMSTEDQTGGEPFVPCEEEWSTKYLNREDVKAAIHVNDKVTNGRKWMECSNMHNDSNPGGSIKYDMGDHKYDMSPYYKYLIDGGYDLKILIYSGDADSVCATSGTQMWMYDLGYDVIDEWKPWTVEQQVVGYNTKFKGFSFVTVHESGHEVPMYQPKRGLEVLKRFLANEW